MAISLGAAVVGVAAGMMILGMLSGLLRNDIYNPRDTPDIKDVGDALRRGKAIKSQWKPVNEKNRVGYGIYAACFLGLTALIFSHRWLIDFINQF